MGTCSGTVLDQEGEPVIGANVKVDGTAVGVTTDIDGRFSIPGVKKGSKIIITSVGFTTAEIVWDGSPMDITLTDDTKALDEVVVVGYGVQKKVNVTGAVSVVDSKVFASRPVQNVSQALQGQVPGLMMSVNNNGGSLDNELAISIRGNGSLNGGSPLVLIDGLEGNMNTVNPNDIESVSVLKDAASASIYGSRAAFGVILITTKNATAGKTHVSYQGNVRFSTATAVPDMVNSLEFANYFNAASIGAGGSAIFNDAALENIRKYMAGEFTDPDTPEYYGASVNANNNRYNAYGATFANTNWFDEFYKKNVPSQEHNLSVSGGTDKLSFVVSGNFLDQQGLLRHGDDKFKRYTLSGKIRAQLAPWVSMNYTAKWTRQDYERPTYMTGLFFHNIARRWPTCPAVDPHGHWYPEMEIIQLEEGGVQWEHKDYYTQQLQFIFEPIKNWTITLDGGLRQLVQSQHWAVLPIYGYDADENPYLLSWNGGAAGYSEVQDYSGGQNYYNTTIRTDYFKQIGDHYIKGMVGFNAELYKNRGLTGFGTDLITATVPELNTTQDDFKAYNSASELSYVGFFGRLNYNYKERYLLEANLRYDGSSRFLKNRRWSWFPSFSVGWNIANEDFFESLRTYITTFKLRGSWGELGNSYLSSYYPFYQSMPNSSNNGGWLINGAKPNTAGLPGLVSSTLTWETVRSWDLGFDIAALNNRLTVGFSYFTRETKDMVATAPILPSVLGVNSPNANNADLKGSGWELEIGWRDRIQDFVYSARFVLDDYMDEITKYDNPTGSLNQWYKGRKVGEIWGYRVAGLAQSQEEMNEWLENNNPNWGSNWQPGDVMYKNLVDRPLLDENGVQKVDEDGNPLWLDQGRVNNGLNTLDDHGDLDIIGNSTPRFKFGLNLSASWKGIDFSMFLQGVMKRDYWVSGPYFWGGDGGQWQSCCFKEHLDYWTPENPDAYYPRASFSASQNRQTSDRYLQNAAYLRIKNIQLGYTLPAQLTKKAGMEQVRVYVSGDNVHTFTKMSKIFDPEALGGGWGNGKLYPLQRVWSVGLNVNF